MVLTFAQELQKPTNEPVVIAHMEPKERLISGWSLESGTIYSIATDFFVVNILNDGVELTEAASSSVSSDEWFFDSSDKTLYVDVGDDPANSFLAVTYRLFYSNKPLDFPYDMSNGKEVPYLALIDSVSNFNDEINPDDLVGIALSGTGSIRLLNDGSFNSIFGRLFWETTKVNIYLGFHNSSPSEFVLIYKGFIDSKKYSIERIDFKLKDFIEKLRSEIPLGLFSLSDGDITNEGAPKKRIYGRAKVLGVSLNKVKDGFSLTGTFSKSGDTTITGSGSDLLNELSVEDEIVYITSVGDEVSYSVQSVDSATSFTLTEEIEEFPDASSITVKPVRSAVPYKNRTYFICDHQMREPATTVSAATGLRFITLNDVTDLESGDTINIGGESKVIRTVSTNNNIVLETSLNSVPSAGTSVTKSPVFNVWKDDSLMVLNRDYTITNGNPSKIVIDELAEFNLAKSKPISDGASSALTFTNGSREITGNVAFQNIFQVWDWVRSDDVTHTTWYQILEVQEDKIIIRSAYGGANRTSDGERRNVELINDDTRILIDASGITEDGVKTGVWVKTASQVVKHILLEQDLEVNTSTFTQANLDAPYLMSVVVPVENGTSRPQARSIIDLVNRSVLGSLHENADREIVYNVLSPRKAAISEIFRQDDFIDYSIDSSGKNISKKVKSNYRHEDADIFTGEYDFDVIEVTNQFIQYISDIEREEQLDLYVWKSEDATILTQRISLLRESANTIVRMRSNSRFLNRALNELVYLEFRDFFNRFGTDADKNFIGVINYLSKSARGTEIEVTDLGGFYNKIATYASSSAPAYGSTDQIDRAQDGYYTDSNGIIDDSKQARMNVYG